MTAGVPEINMMEMGWRKHIMQNARMSGRRWGREASVSSGETAWKMAWDNGLNRRTPTSQELGLFSCISV